MQKEQKYDYCPACGGIITDVDYFCRRIPSVMGYRCSQCGFSQLFVWDENTHK